MVIDLKINLQVKKWNENGVEEHEQGDSNSLEWDKHERAITCMFCWSSLTLIFSVFFFKRTVQRSRSLMETFPLISCLSHKVCHPPSSPFLLRTVSLLIFVEWIENCKKIIKTFQRHPTLSGFRISWALWPLYIGPARGLCIRSGNSVTIVSCHNLKSSGSLIWLKLKTKNLIR